MIESEEDLAAFFDADGFAEEVAIRTGESGSPSTILAIFDTRPPFSATNFKGYKATDDFGRGMGMASGSSPRLLCLSSDVAGVKSSRANAATDTYVTVRGIDYIVFDPEPDGTGMTLLTIKKA